MKNKLIYEIIAIGVGGGLGSILRFILSAWVQNRTKTEYFPWGVLTVNVVGCLLIGILFALLVEQFNTGPLLRSIIFIGLLGGFTTFSSFSLDAITLLYSGAYGTAALYILASVGVGILATAAGITFIRIIFIW